MMLQKEGGTVTASCKLHCLQRISSLELCPFFFCIRTSTSKGFFVPFHSIVDGTGTTKQYKSFLCGIVQILSLKLTSMKLLLKQHLSPHW